ncbi:MAG TPA: GAF domain-containing protein, partial [Chloroflexota bacterium]
MTADDRPPPSSVAPPTMQGRRRDALLRLARRVGAESDPKAVMSALLHEARRFNGATGGFVGRWDEQGQHISELLDSMGQEGQVARRLALGEGAAGRAALERAPIILNDYQNQDDVPPDLLLAGVHAAIAAPMLHDGRLLGVVACVTDDPTWQFTDDDAEMLVMLGSVAAATLVELERRQATQHAQLLADRLEKFIETTSDAIILTDGHGRLIGWNHGAEQLYGWRRDEVLGRVPPHIPSERLDETHELWRVVHEHGQTIASYEDERLTRDGARLPVLTSMCPVRDEGGAIVGVMSIDKDLSALKAVEQQQRLLSRLAERELLAMHLHDNTIQALHGAVLLLSAVERQTDADLDFMRSAARDVREQLSDAIQELRNRLLDLSPSPDEGPRLVTGLERLAHQVRSNVRLHVEVDVDPEVEGLLQPDQVEHLLALASEALFNAVRHAGATRLTLKLTRQGQRIVLVIADNGVGFDTPARARSGHGLTNMAT